MSKKISELPAAPDYTITDYLPIVDAETNATQKLYISQLVTASYGLSASFLTLGDGVTGAPPTTGYLRIPYSSGYVNTIVWNQGGDFPLLRTDASTARWLLGSLGGAYGYVYGYTLGLDGWAGITLGNQGTPAFTVTPSEGSRFFTPTTASLGLLVTSASLKATSGISGSLTNLSDGTSYLVAGSGVTITSASNGQVRIAASPSLPSFHVYLVSGLQTVATPSVFTRIGGSSVDMSAYPSTLNGLTRSVKFVADVQKTSGATNVEVELYDESHAIVVTGTDMSYSLDTNVSRLDSPTLTVGSSAGNLRSDTVSEYSVYLKMNGGSVSDSVFCVNSRLTITYS